MQKFKNLLGEIKNPKINQDIELLLSEIKNHTGKIQANSKDVQNLVRENEALRRELELVCERLDETSSDIRMFVEKSEDARAAFIAVTSWAIFFVAVASAVYVIVNNL